MADLLQRFSGNPYSTPVGQKIEEATDVSLASEDWALNMEICDYINETDDGARDAMRAIKKRLQQSAGKNYKVFNLTLVVLETCVKNCGKRFHVLVTSKDFVQELVKLIGPKNDPPAAIQEKVLSLIQSWAEAFHGQPELQGIWSVYNELRSKGVEFPKSTSEPKVPIHTPVRHSSNVDTVDTAARLSSSPPQRNLSRSPPQQQQYFPQTGGHPQQAHLAMSSGPPPASSIEAYPFHLSPEQLNKLRNELEIVQGNIKVFSEMLTELKPGQEHRDDLELLVDLHSTCQAMQRRIMDLIEKVANEEVTSELLRLNDELNNLFLRYDRYQKKQGHSSPDTTDNILSPSTSAGPPKPSAAAAAAAAPIKPTVPSLIDFGEEPDQGLLPGMQNLQISQTKGPAEGQAVPPETASGDHDFDMFAQLRSQPQGESSAAAAAAGPAKPPRADDLMLLDPMTTSLSGGATTSTTTTTANNGTSSSSTEANIWLNSQQGGENPARNVNFEQYLQRRADVLEQQPVKKSAGYNNQDTSLI